MMRLALMAAAAVLVFTVGCGAEKDPPAVDKDDEKVGEAPIVSIELRSEGTFEVGLSARLKTVGKTEAGGERTLTEGVAYTSSNEAVATVDDEGAVTTVAGGPVVFTARADGFEATLDAAGTCKYPNYSPTLQFNRVAPKLSWPAKSRDGTDFEFRFDELHCNAEWKDTKTLAIVLSAGWCTPCTLYAQRLETEFERLEELGMQIMIVEVQDKDYELADLGFAWDHLNNITKTVPGIVVGDLDTQPTSGYLQELPLLKAFPTTLVIRTRDMKVIADSSRITSYLPLAQIAADPEADWANAAPVFRNECGPGDEEASEPNDGIATAAPITVAGTYPGGICADGPDMYRVELSGEWTASLAFDNGVGDLDIFVWDETREQPAQDGDGNVIGSATSNDVESFNYSGTAIIAIQGYQRASAPYTLTITGR